MVVAGINVVFVNFVAAAAVVAAANLFLYKYFCILLFVIAGILVDNVLYSFSTFRVYSSTLHDLIN